MVEIRRTYKYRMNRAGRRNRKLHNQIDIAGIIWNRCVALQRRYYRLTGKYISEAKLKKHIADLRRDVPHFTYWQKLNSQTVQEVIERLHKAYQRFFAGRGRRPHFKKVKKYSSFTLKQSGWKLLSVNKIRIGNTTHKFVKHRDIPGMIKTITVKRDKLGRLWICFNVVEKLPQFVESSTGKIGGFDFGLRTFLTNDQGKSYLNPQFFKRNQREIAKYNCILSRKKKGSRNRQRAKRKLSRAHICIADKRRDFHFKLTHQLCDEYDWLFFECLNLDGMKRLWGRKVSDLGFSNFLQRLEHTGKLTGSLICFIDRFEPSSKRCSQCGCVKEELLLSERTYTCKECGLSMDRDHNAARNIVWVGASTQGLEVVSRSDGVFLDERSLA
jgi:putative transposase